MNTAELTSHQQEEAAQSGNTSTSFLPSNIGESNSPREKARAAGQQPPVPELNIETSPAEISSTSSSASSNSASSSFVADDPKKYNDDDISDYTALMVRHKLGGFVIMPNGSPCQFLLRDKFVDQNDEIRKYFVAITDAVDTAGLMFPIDYFLDKSRQIKSEIARVLNTVIPDLPVLKQMPDDALQEKLKEYLLVGIYDDEFRKNIFEKLKKANFEYEHLQALIQEAEEHKQTRDVFEELIPEMLKVDNCYAKIVFPYNITNVHWLSAEIKITKNGHNYNVEIYAHDPYGEGQMSTENYDIMKKTIEKCICREDKNATVTCVNKASQYTRRQLQEDAISCGIITAEDIIKLIQCQSLNIEHPYEYGALSLRKQHCEAFGEEGNLVTKQRFSRRVEAAKQAIESQQKTLYFTPQSDAPSVKLALSEKNTLVRLINTLKNQDLKNCIVGAITNAESYNAKDGSYLVLVKSAIEERVVLLQNQHIEIIDEEDIKAINQIHRILFFHKIIDVNAIYDVGAALTTPNSPLDSSQNRSTPQQTNATQLAITSSFHSPSSFFVPSSSRTSNGKSQSYLSSNSAPSGTNGTSSSSRSSCVCVPYCSVSSSGSSTEAGTQFKSFLSAFIEHVKKTPNSIALVEQSMDSNQLIKVTYQKLWEESLRLAQYLQRKQLPKGACVGLYFDSLPDMVISILATWQAGLAYVPLSLHTSISDERLGEIVTDSKPVLILTDQRFKQRCFIGEMLSKNPPVEYVDAILKSQPLDASMPVRDIKPENLAYIIYSSGTTGKPKGIEIEQRGLYNCAYFHQDFLDITAEDKVAQYGDIGFDASLAEIMSALVCGAKLYKVPNKIRLDSAKLKEFYQTNQITVGIFTPSNLRDLNPKDFPKLRVIIAVGEAFPDEVLKKWRDDWLQAETSQPKDKKFLVNGYGPSEVTICTGMGKCIDSVVITNSTPGLKLFVLDKAKYVDDNKTEKKADAELLLPLPQQESNIEAVIEALEPGQEGELYIACAEGCENTHGIARGYHNNPDLSHKRFGWLKIKKPGQSDEEAKVYRVFRTRDEVRLTEQGLQVIRRLDDHLKVRGMMVNTAKVKQALAVEYPNVCDIQLAVNKAGELIALFEMKESSTLEVDALRELLKKKEFGLVEHEIPTRFGIILKNANLPKKSTGKVNISELINDSNSQCIKWLQPKGEQQGQQTEPVSQLPQNEIFIKVRNAWEEVLNPDENLKYQVSSLDDNFTTYGGNSLKFSLLQGKLRSLNLDLDYATFLDSPTIGFLYRSLEKKSLSLCEELCNPILSSDVSPLFLVPGILGDGTKDFKSLQKEWGPKRGLYTFKASGLLSGNEERGTESINEIATLYVESLLEKLKELCYSHSNILTDRVLLGGYSSGCTIAYEMAIQLEQQHGIPTAMFLFDGVAPTVMQSLSDKQHAEYLCNTELIIKIGSQVGIGKLELPDAEKLLAELLEKDPSTKKFKIKNKQIKYIFELLRQKLAEKHSSDASFIENKRILNVAESLALASLAYTPCYWVEQTVLIKAESSLTTYLPEFLRKATFGWLLQSSNDTCIRIINQSNHFDLLTTISKKKKLDELLQQEEARLRLRHARQELVKQYEHAEHTHIRFGLGEKNQKAIQESYINNDELQREKEKETLQKVEREGIHTGILSSYEDYDTQREKPVALAELFKGDPQAKENRQKQPKRILITGRAGIGKSTLCQYIVHQWRAGMLWNDRFDIVIWLKLRNLNNQRYQKNLTKFDELGEILQKELFTDNPNNLDEEQQKRELVTIIHAIKSNPSRILFLLDGYDEFGDHCSNCKEAIDKLIKENNYYTIVTSRPFVSLPEHGTPDLTVQIMGFTQDDIFNYIKQYFKGNEEKINSMKAFFQNNASALGLAHIPLMLELLCVVCENGKVADKTKIATMTITQLFCELEKFLFQHYGKKLDEKGGKEKKLLKRKNYDIGITTDFLCLLAFMSMEKGEIIFSRQQLINCFKRMQQDDPSRFLPYEDIQHSFDDRIKPIVAANFLHTPDREHYYFLHYQFQEFFAAKYLTKLILHSNSKQKQQAKEFISKHKYEQRLQYVLGFAVGLLNSEGENDAENGKEALKQFFEVFFEERQCNELNDKYKDLVLMRFLEEGQLLEILDKSNRTKVWDAVEDIITRAFYSGEDFDFFKNVTDMLAQCPLLMNNQTVQNLLLNLLCEHLKSHDYTPTSLINILRFLNHHYDKLSRDNLQKLIQKLPKLLQHGYSGDSIAEQEYWGFFVSLQTAHLIFKYCLTYRYEVSKTSDQARVIQELIQGTLSNLWVYGKGDTKVRATEVIFNGLDTALALFVVMAVQKELSHCMRLNGYDHAEVQTTELIEKYWDKKPADFVNFVQETLGLVVSGDVYYCHIDHVRLAEFIDKYLDKAPQEVVARVFQETLPGLLAHEDGHVQIQAVELIIKHLDKDKVPQEVVARVFKRILPDLLAHEDRYVRNQAAQLIHSHLAKALVKDAARVFHETLSRFLAHEDKHVQLRVAELIFKYLDKAPKEIVARFFEETLPGLLQHKDRAVQIRAAKLKYRYNSRYWYLAPADLTARGFQPGLLAAEGENIDAGQNLAPPPAHSEPRGEQTFVNPISIPQAIFSTSNSSPDNTDEEISGAVFPNMS